MTTGPEPQPIATLLFSHKWVTNALPKVVWARLATPDEVDKAETMLRRLNIPPESMVGTAAAKSYWVTILANAPTKVKTAVAILGSMAAAPTIEETNHVH